jgi:AraC-like DNA-binding protein
MQAFHYVNSLSECPVTVKEVRVPSFSVPWHFHSECELVLVLDSYGKRIVGDHIGNFMAGDLVFMGPDLPHVWYNDPEYHHRDSCLTAHAVVVYFKPEWLSNSFFGLAGAVRLSELLVNAKRGMRIGGQTQFLIKEKMQRLPGLQGLKLVIELLGILDILSHSREYADLASVGFTHSFNETDVQRINRVYQYVMQHFNRKIQLEAVARVANMTPNAFCRYFKMRTQKTFSSFVNEMRVGYACKLLLSKDYSVTQICFESGFQNLTNFNKFFRHFTGQAPTEYRKNLLE